MSLGVSYKSAIRHKVNGTVTTEGLLGPLSALNGKVDALSTFSLPWQFGVGARYAVTPSLTLNTQYVRYGWGKFATVELGAPIDADLPIGFRNSWTLAGGFDLAISSRWAVRGGVQRDISPARDGTREERIPDGDR